MVTRTVGWTPKVRGSLGASKPCLSPTWRVDYAFDPSPQEAEAGDLPWHVFEASLDLQDKIIFGIQLYQANLGYHKTLGKGKKGLAPVLSQEGDCG